MPPPPLSLRLSGMPWSQALRGSASEGEAAPRPRGGAPDGATTLSKWHTPACPGPIVIIIMIINAGAPSDGPAPRELATSNKQQAPQVSRNHVQCHHRRGRRQGYSGLVAPQEVTVM